MKNLILTIGLITLLTACGKETSNGDISFPGTTWKSNFFADLTSGNSITETWAFSNSTNQVTVTRRGINDALIDTTNYTYTIDGDAFVLDGVHRVSIKKIPDNQNFQITSYGGRNYANLMHYGRQF